MEMRFTDRAHPELPGFGQFSSGCFARRQVVGSLADACACLVSGFSEQQFGSASAHVGKQRRCLRCVEQRQAEGPAAMGPRPCFVVIEFEPFLVAAVVGVRRVRRVRSDQTPQTHRTVRTVRTGRLFGGLKSDTCGLGLAFQQSLGLKGT